MKILGKHSLASVLKLWLDILFYIVIAAAVILVVVGAFYLVAPDREGLELDAPVAFRLDEDAIDITSDKLGVEKAIITHATGTLRCSVSVRPLIAMYILLGAVIAVVVLFVLLYLRRIFRSLIDGHPFTLENARRLRWIALTVIFGELASSLVVFLTQRYIRANFEAEGLILNADLAADLSTIFGGFVLLVIAELFRIGAELQKEKELTV